MHDLISIAKMGIKHDIAPSSTYKKRGKYAREKKQNKIFVDDLSKAKLPQAAVPSLLRMRDAYNGPKMEFYKKVAKEMELEVGTITQAIYRYEHGRK